MEAKYRDQWVVFVDEEFIEAFDDFQEAAMMAIRRWGKGPYPHPAGGRGTANDSDAAHQQVGGCRALGVGYPMAGTTLRESVPAWTCRLGSIRAFSPTRRTTEHPG